MTLTLLTPLVERGLIAIDKPAGLTVIPGRDEAVSARQLLEKQLGRPVWVVHRIDRDTSGVVVFALDAESHRTASMAFEAGRVRKSYLALVQGRVEQAHVVDLALVPARKNRMRPAAPGEQGKEAKTEFLPERVFATCSLVRAIPHTGRQHQIRVHARAFGHPLLFDHQYGNKVPLTVTALGGTGDEVVLARTPLHAASLSIPELNFECASPIAVDLQRALDVLEATRSP